jgi:beta-glucosidase
MADTDAILDAFVMAYLPGDYGARAIADVLIGDFNPSGRLPITWPRYASSHLTHDRKHTENDSISDSDELWQPLYPFGHGLSYSEVSTTSLEVLNDDTVVMGDSLDIKVTLENHGNRSTTETVILYSQDHVASITPSVDELKAFKQVVVPAGSTLDVELAVSTKDLGFIGRDNKYIVEPGKFGFRVKNQVAEINLIK